MCHLPFGIGPRSCLGGKFAFMEAKMAMISILKQYQFVQGKDTKVSNAMLLISRYHSDDGQCYNSDDG